jgi:plasmid stability protein
MVRINIVLPEDLHRKLKIICAMKGVSIKDYVITILNSELSSMNIGISREEGKK